MLSIHWPDEMLTRRSVSAEGNATDRLLVGEAGNRARRNRRLGVDNEVGVRDADIQRSDTQKDWDAHIQEIRRLCRSTM